MDRFWGALSVTLLLSGLTALVQIQPLSDPVDQVVQAGLMTPIANDKDQADMLLSRAELASILVKTFHLDQHQPAHTVAAVTLEDVSPSHWAYDDIQLVLQHGIMHGYREGRFYPEQRITRAEAFSIFAQAYGIFQFSEPVVTQVLDRYPDASQIPSWARKSMATALHEGFVNLKPDHRIEPLSPMTKEDIAYALRIYLQRQETPAQLPWQHKNWLGS
jgi:hypothetical protein